MRFAAGSIGPGTSLPFRYTFWEGSMLYTIAVILVGMWLLGMVSSYTIGGFIHILLVLAIILTAANLGLSANLKRLQAMMKGAVSG